MNVEEGKRNFSTDDPVNVSIPDALAPLAHEYFSGFVLGLKREHNPILHSSILEALQSIASLNHEFFFHSKRFESTLWPIFLSIIEKGKSDWTTLVRLRLIRKIILLVLTLKIFNQDDEMTYSEEFKEKLKIDLMKIEIDLKNLLNEASEKVSEVYQKELKKILYLLDLILRKKIYL